MQPAQLIQLLLCFLVVPATDAQRGKGPQREEPFVPPVTRRLLREDNRDGQCRAPQPNCMDLIGGKCISFSNACTLCGPPGHLLADYGCNDGPEDYCCVTDNECIDAGGSCQFKVPWLEGGSEGQDDSKKFTTALRCGNNTQLQCLIDIFKANCSERNGVCTDSEECRDGESLGDDSCGSGRLCCVPHSVQDCTNIDGECIPIDQKCCGEVCGSAPQLCIASTKCCTPPVADGLRCSIFPNVNFTGDSMEIIPSMKSQACCEKMCTITQGCSFYTWIGPSFSDPSRHFNCLMQRNVNTVTLPMLITSPVEGMTSGFKGCERGCDQGDLIFIGVSLGNTTEPNESACRRKCEDNSSCDFWYYQDLDKQCFLQESGMSGNGSKLPMEIKANPDLSNFVTSGFPNCTNDNSPLLGPNPDTCYCDSDEL